MTYYNLGQNYAMPTHVITSVPSCSRSGEVITGIDFSAIQQQHEQQQQQQQLHHQHDHQSTHSHHQQQQQQQQQQQPTHSVQVPLFQLAFEHHSQNSSSCSYQDLDFGPSNATHQTGTTSSTKGVKRKRKKSTLNDENIPKKAPVTVRPPVNKAPPTPYSAEEHMAAIMWWKLSKYEAPRFEGRLRTNQSEPQQNERYAYVCEQFKKRYQRPPMYYKNLYERVKRFDNNLPLLEYIDSQVLVTKIDEDTREKVRDEIRKVQPNAMIVPVDVAKRTQVPILTVKQIVHSDADLVVSRTHYFRKPDATPGMRRREAKPYIAPIVPVTPKKKSKSKENLKLKAKAKKLKAKEAKKLKRKNKQLLKMEQDDVPSLSDQENLATDESRSMPCPLPVEVTMEEGTTPVATGQSSSSQQQPNDETSAAISNIPLELPSETPSGSNDDVDTITERALADAQVPNVDQSSPDAQAPQAESEAPSDDLDKSTPPKKRLSKKSPNKAGTWQEIFSSSSSSSSSDSSDSESESSESSDEQLPMLGVIPKGPLTGDMRVFVGQCWKKTEGMTMKNGLPMLVKGRYEYVRKEFVKRYGRVAPTKHTIKRLINLTQEEQASVNIKRKRKPSYPADSVDRIRAVLEQVGGVIMKEELAKRVNMSIRVVRRVFEHNPDLNDLIRMPTVKKDYDHYKRVIMEEKARNPSITRNEIAKNIGIGIQTLYNWMRKDQQLADIVGFKATKGPGHVYHS